MSRLELDAPNWKRFLKRYPEYAEYAAGFETRYDGMLDSKAKTKLAKLVNVELGIALLKETEIDQEAFSKMLSAIAK